jgi:hypothetical protein
MGGSKERNRPANIIVFCSLANGLMESNATFAEVARAYGWKLLGWEDPAKVPAFLSDDWYLLDDNFGRVRTSAPEEE